MHQVDRRWLRRTNPVPSYENMTSSEVKTTEQSLCGKVYTTRSLADWCNLKYGLLVHASGEPGNEANKREHELIIA